MHSGSFKMGYQQTIWLQTIHLIYIYQQDLALNNLQGLICHKTQPTNQPTLHPVGSCSNYNLVDMS